MPKNDQFDHFYDMPIGLHLCNTTLVGIVFLENLSFTQRYHFQVISPEPLQFASWWQSERN